MNNEVQSFVEKVNKSDNFLILTHENPDGDAIGSALALKLILNKLGKKVDVYAQLPLSSNIDCFASNNDFTAEDSLKSEYEICIAVDCSSRSYLYGKDFIMRAKELLVIDHHITNEVFGDINVVDKKAAATSEIICSIMDKLKVQLDKKIATLLYVAVSTDTGSFSYSNTTSHTHLMAARLLETGIDTGKINDRLRIRNFNSLKIYEYALSSIECFNDNKTIVMLLSDYEKIKDINTEGLIDFIRYVRGCVLAVLIKRLSDGSFKVSLRSADDKMDVSKVAAKYNGGGHKKAAGFSFKGSEEELLKLISSIEV